MYNNEVKEITSTISNYFEGIYNGDLKKLEEAFHPQCLLIGDVNGKPYFKTLSEYLLVVRDRKSPKELDETFNMKIISIEVLNSVAFAKLHSPMLGYNYYDYLSLNKIDSKWLIVNKVFTNELIN